MLLVLCSACLFGASWAAPAPAPSPGGEAPSAKYTTKVVSLLDELIKEVQADGTADDKSHQAYTTWYTKERADANKVLVESKGSVSRLTTALQQEESLREQLQQDLDDVAGKLPGLESDLQEATGTRKKEREEYEELSTKLEQNIDGLRRSLIVLEKELPAQDDLLQTAAGPAKGPQDLMAVAKQLQQNMEGTGHTMNSGERELLSALFSAAKALKRHKLPTQPVQFLQVSQESAADGDEDDYGEYTSQTGGVTKLLENVLKKSEAQLQLATTNEQSAAKVFNALKASLEKQIAGSKQRMSDIKSQIAKSQERSGRKGNDLHEAQLLVESSTATIKQLDEQNAVRNKNYQDRSQTRSDELTALQEAKEILSSPSAQMLMAVGSQTVRDDSADEASVAAADEAEVSDSDGKDESAALSFLMLKSSQRAGSKSQVSEAADPFGKVRKLMQDMLERLNGEQAKDQRQKAFCDNEMRRTLDSLHDKKKAVKKLTDEVEALDAEISTLEAEIPELATELSELLAAVGNATELRAEEKGNAEKAIKQYKDAQVPLQGAIKVLQEFYAKSGMEFQQLKATGSESQEPEETQYKAKSGAIAGVIGILEVALEDMKGLQKDSEEQEAKAQELFQEFKNDADVRSAVLNKDLEYKNRMKVRLESTRAQTASDLKNYQKELDAVESYLEQLKESCTIKGDSYEERKAKREREIQGLQDALSILEGEAL